MDVSGNEKRKNQPFLSPELRDFSQMTSPVIPPLTEQIVGSGRALGTRMKSAILRNEKISPPRALQFHDQTHRSRDQRQFYAHQK